MGLLDFFREETLLEALGRRNLSYSDRELIIVQHIRMSDMLKFTGFPYVWNSSIKKIINPHTHPFAYMNLCGPNIEIAKAELQKLSDIISNSHKLSRTIPTRLYIPVGKVVFDSNAKRGYSKIICSPFTITGSPSEYPASLYFTTDLDFISSTTHGELFYNQNGGFGKAQVYFWRNGIGYFFYFCTVDGVFTLSKVETTSASASYSPPTVIYKAQYLLEIEARRQVEELDFRWMQRNIPDKCPKSLAGYRRMKTQNTKNYQTLQLLAAKLGRKI